MVIGVPKAEEEACINKLSDLHGVEVRKVPA
jgi:hypothetical protein